MQTTGPVWVPIAEAARQCGVSIDTVRRRIKRGELVAERRETPQGFVWWVCLGDGMDLGSSASYVDAQVGSAPPRRNSEAPYLAALVRELQAEIMRRTEAAATWQTRAELLAHQLAAAEDKIKMLEAPAPVPGPSLEPIPPTPNSMPWWRHRLVPHVMVVLVVLAIVSAAVAPAWVR